MSPKSVAKESPASTIKWRRSARIRSRTESAVKEPLQSGSEESPAPTKKGRRNARIRSRTESEVKEPLQSGSEESPAPTKKGRRTVSVRYGTKAHGQLPSTSGEASSTKVKGKQRKMTRAKKENASANERQSTPTVKKRRIMDMDEIKERASRMGLEDQEDFEAGISQILKEISPDLTISEEAIAEMNIYLNYTFERLARAAGVFVLEKSGDCMDVVDVETALLRILDGELGKYCLCEGRRAVKLWNKDQDIDISSESNCFSE